MSTTITTDTATTTNTSEQVSIDQSSQMSLEAQQPVHQQHESTTSSPPPSTTSTSIGNESSPKSDGADEKKEKDTLIVTSPTITTANTATSPTEISDISPSIISPDSTPTTVIEELPPKRKDGSVGDVVDNEKVVVVPKSDPDAPEESSSSLKSEINVPQILFNPATSVANGDGMNGNFRSSTNQLNIPLELMNSSVGSSSDSVRLELPSQEDRDRSLTDSPGKSKLGQSGKFKPKTKPERKLSHVRPRSIKLEHKKNLIGDIIYKGHPSWALMMNIQTGIRNAVGKNNINGPSSSGQFHTLREPKDFKNKADFYTSPKELRFDSTGTSQTEAHTTGPFKFKDYCPMAFRYLRYRFGIDQADFLVSLCNTLKNGENALRELPTPGKSGSLFFFSHDMKFIIKTIPKDEAKLLRTLLPDYTEHLTQNPNTLLPRFFGLFRVKPHGGRQVRFVVMGNNFPTRKKIHQRYDLKGSIIGREASDNEKKSETVTLKDIDFRNSGKKICIGPAKRVAFLDQIKKDCKLLESLNIMDYSLLVGIHCSDKEPPSPSFSRHNLGESYSDINVENSPIMSRSRMEQSSLNDTQELYIGSFQQDEGGVKGVGEDGQPNGDIYFMGIIDILMLYSLRKKVEHTYKTLKYGGESKHEISSVSPKEYSVRFQEFLETIII